MLLKLPRGDAVTQHAAALPVLHLPISTNADEVLFMSLPTASHPLSLYEADSKWPPSALKLIIIVFPNLCSAGHYISCY